MRQTPQERPSFDAQVLSDDLQQLARHRRQLASMFVPAAVAPLPSHGMALARSAVPASGGAPRCDVRASLTASTTVAQGLPMVLTLTLADVDVACAPLAGHAVYLWQCDRGGNCSLYSIPAESYLRGVQVSDAEGRVSFATVVPGCHAGRWPHMHLEVFRSLDEATSGRKAVLTSQLAMPADLCSQVYKHDAGYAPSRVNFAGLLLARYNFIADTNLAQMAVITPTVEGSLSSGFSARATISLTR